MAGIDENGTFRAWDNAKTVAKSKKADSPKSSVEERAADKKATVEAEKKPTPTGIAPRSSIKGTIETKNEIKSALDMESIIMEKKLMNQ